MINSVPKLHKPANGYNNSMKLTKVILLALLCVSSLCLISTQVMAQTSTTETVYIQSDGSIYSSANSTVPIEREGNVYTFTDDMTVYSFVVQCSNIIIDGAGFSLEGQGEVGIELVSNAVTIQNLNLLGGFNYGVYISGSSFHTLVDNTISGNGAGLRIYNSTQNTLTGNTIHDNNIGLELWLAPENLFQNNVFDNFRDLSFYGTELSHYVQDIDKSNVIGDNKKIYYLVDESNLVIDGETDDVGFLALVSCSNITVKNLEVSDNEQGIILADTTGSSVTHSTLTGTSYGISLFSSSSNSISYNTLTENNRGIHLKTASFNTISANEIVDNIGGMFFFDSTQNIVSGNTIQDNEDYGLGLSASSLNSITGNHFINNGQNGGYQVYDPALTNSSLSYSSNSWSVTYPAGGNFWSDYAGTDVKSGVYQNESSSDGIGDTPYTIYANIQDKYPRMVEGALIVSVISPENKTYAENSVTLNIDVNDATSVVGYSLDGEQSITYSGQTTLSNLYEGSHELTVIAKNTENKESSQTVYFTVSDGDTQTPINGDHPEDLDITLIVAIAAIAVVAVALLYFLILKKK
ncbi:MAG: right-handed parallel beta-helix repeat-containing protein [Candidatus Bathyarchaeota archaeon]|nr:right-handed parallel beta-helix repeat-containing protein [Candidatus Bathyarchaeum sp.]